MSSSLSASGSGRRTWIFFVGRAEAMTLWPEVTVDDGVR
jgi:hypothetical protein